MPNSEWFIIKSPIDTSHLFIRNVKNKILRKIPFKINNYELIGNTQNYLFLRTKNDGGIWIYTLSTGKINQINNVRTNRENTYSIYTSPDKKTIKVIALSKNTISIITLPKNGVNYAEKGILPIERITDKGRGFTNMDIVNGMLRVKLADESHILLFLDGHKNQFSVYAPLSPQERQRYLGK